MDNVTHAALGLAVAEAAFPWLRGTGLGLALVASELPDIDIFFGWGNPWSMVTTHRGITHSILLVPVAAAALASIWSWLSSAGTFATFFLLALVCLLGHVFLDVLTTYGTQILEPFSRHRVGWGWVAVIDPVVTIALLAGGLAAWWVRSRHPGLAGHLALAGLLVTAAYVGLGGLMHARAMRQIARQTASLGKPIAADATPQLGTIFLWRLLYNNGTTFWVARYNSLSGRLTGAVSQPAGLDPSLAPLLEVPEAQVFRNFAGGLVRPHLEAADPDVLVLEDMRFSWPTGSPVGLWALRMRFQRDGQGPPRLLKAEFLQRRLRFNGGPAGERASPVPLASR